MKHAFFFEDLYLFGEMNYDLISTFILHVYMDFEWIWHTKDF